MNTPHIITIDGPAGAGKSTLGALLAHRLGYLYFDTGIMYRALTFAVLDRKLDPQDSTAITELARTLDICIRPSASPDERHPTVLIAGRDITHDLRRLRIERNVSHVACHQPVRAIMRSRQREIGLRGKIVMVGRDIGNVVMPDAPLKIYLETSLEERARRRTDELRADGRAIQIGDVASDVERRDSLDRHVTIPAPDALIINNDDLSPEEEVEVILAHVAQNQWRPSVVSGRL